MYQIENSRQVLESGRKLTSRRGLPRVSRNVVFLGLTSLFTDVSSEMVSTVLPIYLVLTLGVTPIAFGIIDGLYQGASVLVRVASGLVSDRWRHPKRVATLGYGLSAVCKLGLLAAQGAFGVLTSFVLLDRIGKGIRTAPRDTMISLSSSAQGLATAFGVHRALDTAGAMLGPLIAFILLAAIPGAFDAVFVVSFCAAVIGLALLVLFVKDPARSSDTARETPNLTGKAVRELLGARRFQAIVAIGGALGLVTISDSFIYLALQRRLDLNVGFFPLLFVATALVYMVLAVPLGQLADRFGRSRVFIAGYAALAIVYLALLLPDMGPLAVVAVIGLLGAYYAMTDGVLAAIASAIVPADVRGTGLSLLATATSVGRLAASVLFGIAWTVGGVQAAVLLFLAALVGVSLIAAWLLGRKGEMTAIG